MSLIILILISMADVLLTHYQAFLLLKKDVFRVELERNLIPRFIMGKKPSAFSFLKGAIYNICFILAMMHFLNYAKTPLEDMNFFIFGVTIALCVVMFYHVDNIVYLKNNWDNDEYWILKRKIRKVERM